MSNLRKKIKREIKYFKKKGRLLKTREIKRHLKVINSRATYWDWVNRDNNGLEPVENTGHVVIGQSEISATDYAARFTKWLAEEFVKLDDDSKELFSLYWEKNVSQANLCQYFQCSRPTIAKRLDELKARIAKYMGLKNYA